MTKTIPSTKHWGRTNAVVIIEWKHSLLTPGGIHGDTGETHDRIGQLREISL